METPTNNSTAGFATASDGEGSIQQHRTAARSNTVYAPRPTAERLDPRRAATLDPRQAGQTYSFVPEDYEDTDDSVLAAVLDAGDQTVRGTENVPRRAMTSNSFPSQGYVDPVPDVVLDETAGRGGAQEAATPSLDAGDRTVRRPEGVSGTTAFCGVEPAPGSRIPTPFHRVEQARDGPTPATVVSAGTQCYVPCSWTHRISSVTPTWSAWKRGLPSGTDWISSPTSIWSACKRGSPSSRTDWIRRLTSIWSARTHPIPSSWTNRIGSSPPSGPPKPAAPPRQDETVYPPRPAAPAALPSKPAPPTRQDQHAPQTPTTVRPSNASNRPLIPAKQTPQPPRKVPPVTSQRPPLPAHASQMDTRYVRMLLAIDDIPSVYNILANFFTWILLAGFVLFPGTFTSLQQNSQLSAIGVTAVNVVKHVTLYVIAWVCTGVGAAGMVYLWIKWRGNYIWCLDRIFLPGLMNSLAGVLSTISSILGTQNATLSISSTSTIIVTSAVAGISGILTAFYMLVLVRGLKNEHIRKVGKQHAGKHGEGYAELERRKGGYVNMLLALDSIPSYYNLFAQFFTWILLAGFVLFPGTFTNLQQDKELGAIGIFAANTIKHLSLFVVAWVCTGLGAAGMLYLWYRWSRNYIWCTNRIFLPGFTNSLAGVLSTISSVLGTQNATLSTASKSTLIVTTTVTGTCGLLTALYMFVLIRGMKNQYERETGKHG
ncbi:hypothetical protein MSAN_00689200 [Mycena sanguinolenta]|uniref:Uncharacterized protein n=1 Tax=Mycena sanguinolenta TaxID=230812 RepID=A0A8H6Z1M1_9AGAR|nr:hypothetical protein MSAN_00689200 [Mycena sanguinolenta]